MAEKLTALSHLKTAFSDFDAMSKLVDDMRVKIDEINTYNKESAGSDDIGQNYHVAVDDQTKSITELMTDVRADLDHVAVAGQDTADEFTNADQNAADLAHGM